MKVSEFSYEDSWSIPKRMAEFLLFAAKQHPGGFVAYPLVARAIYGLGAKGRVPEDLVSGIKRRVASVNKLMHREYGCAVVTDPTVGVRATHNDDDAANTALRRRMSRLASAQRNVVSTVAIIDPKKVKNPALRSYMEKDAKEIVAMITTPKFQQRLLPPPIDDDEV